MRKINIDNVSKMFSYPVDNFQKNRVQCQNPKSKEWVKIDTLEGRIVGRKATPYKNVRRVG